jgi:hypothetical protein
MFRRLPLTLLVAVVALVFAGQALAGGGNYTFSGGTKAEQANVKAALDASSFNWSIVPAQITIRIGPGFPSAAWQGTISLDSNVVDAGSLAWGTIMHEYAHQVDYFVLTDAQRGAIQASLGGKSWWFKPGLVHSDLTCERFASTLAWAYWAQQANMMSPSNLGTESSAMAPAKFRALLARLIGAPDSSRVSSTALRTLH